ncbi:MAG: hypothetical protein JWO06_3213 [Bacteroidota bacterium]|nr:hypothetical protein [Bacteroidota bacterium]
MKHILWATLIMSTLAGFAQDSLSVKKKKEGWFDLHDKFYQKRIYVYWGYNRDYFSHSDIHFHGPGYDFTIYDVSAHDRQSKFSFNTYLNPENLPIPQYNFRGGFYIKHNIHISFGIDHMKYVMDQNQTVKMSGIIDSSVSPRFAGAYVNKDVVLTNDFIRFEHTNGLNLVTLDVAWMLPIYHTKQDWIHIGWNFGIGGLFVITKTEVHVVGIGLDNKFHLSGVSIPLTTGPRIDIWKCFFFSAELKAGYMHLPWVPVRNTKVDGIDHNFTFLEYYIVGGLSFRIDKSEYPFLKRKKRVVTPPSN